MTRFALTLAALSLVGRAAMADPARPAPTAKPALAPLAWIAGHWVDESDEARSEEIWTAPSGNSMIGMWRYVSRGKLQIFEVLSITEEEAGPVFRLRHFDPRMVAREEKERPLALALSSLKDGEAAFEGPGQPTGTVRLTYRRAGADRMTVTLDRDGRSQLFHFRRQSR